MPKLWEKGTETLDKEIEQFEVGDDYLLDMKLAPFDVYGSAAHALMLHKIDILSTADVDAILKGLKEILGEIEEGKFTITVTDEDVHTKVENLLVQRIGDAGKKLHTARSRNDQILVDTRLYSKFQLLTLGSEIAALCETLLKFAEKYEFVPIPGYTHMQLAMPSSIGMWASAFVENMIDELTLLDAVARYNDMNPLGSGAGYGVSLDIDRVLTTSLLGFDRVQRNCMYCGNTRGKVEANILSVLSSFGLILNRIASDLLLFTTKEFAFFKIKGTITTGSSIMPQKKNLDVMELMRGRTHVLLGYEQTIKNLIANLPSGYNRDYQETKKCLVNAFDLLHSMVKVTSIVIDAIVPDEERLRSAHKSELYATDLAYDMVKKGKPFRDAYREVGTNLDKIPAQDPVQNIKSKKHVGATGNLELIAYQRAITQFKSEWEEKKNTFQHILDEIFEKGKCRNCK